MSEQRSLALAALAELNTAGAVTATARAGALLLATLADEWRVVEMSRAELACRLDCDERTAGRILADLLAAGVIRLLVSGKGRRRGSRYEVLVAPLARGSSGDPCRGVRTVPGIGPG